MDRPQSEFDVVIVGAGAAGAFFAARLAEAGKSIALIDAGPGWELSDLTSSQIWARRLHWGGAPVSGTGANPFGHNFNMGWGMGGSAIHHFGVWLRLHEEDFEMKSRFGRGLDWPFGYDELRPYYDRIQSEVGLSGDADAEVWRPPGEPYPLPPLRSFRGTEVVRRGFEALGFRSAPTPVAILSEDYDGRPACIYDGWCEAGCPIGALYNPLLSDIPRARAADADLRARTTALRLLIEPGGRVAGVETADAEGNFGEIRAGTTIIAAANVHSARLLLNSVSPEHPTGVGNRGDMVGRYFMSHPLTNHFGLFDENIENHRGVTGGNITTRDPYPKDLRENAFGSYQWLAGLATKPNDLLGIAMSRVDLFGTALDQFMGRAVKGLAQMNGMCEALPLRENRIELTGEPDHYGAIKARVVQSLPDETVALIDHVNAEGVKIYEAAGAVEAWHGPVPFAHMMGGTVMGSGPDDSVADSHGRVHESPNVVLAGAGLFPTAGAVNPTFTVYALAQRTLDHMLDHWSEYAA